MPYAVLGLLTLVLWIYCLVDIITCPEDAGIRHLPKFGWLLIVIILPDIGALLWLFAGRPIRDSVRSNTRYSEYDRPGRYVPQNAEDDEAFLRGLRERAESQRREARRQEEERQRDVDRRRAQGDL